MRRVTFCRRLACLALAGGLLLFAAGCGVSGGTEDRPAVTEGGEETALAGEMVPMAEYQEIRLDLKTLDQYAWQGGFIYYLEKAWNEEREMQESTLFRTNVDGTGTPEALYSGASDKRSVLCFTIGQDQALYFMERQAEEGKDAYYLRKLDRDLQEVYQRRIEEEDFLRLVRETYPVSQMYVDGKGNLLTLASGGKVCLFDSEGRFLGVDGMESPEMTHRFVDAGEQGCFLVCQDAAAMGISTYLFQKVNFAGGRLEEPERKDLSAARGQETESIAVLGGGSHGVLVSAESRLCSYDYGTGVCVELLDWQRLGVDGSIVRQLSFPREDFPLENLNGYAAASAGEGTGQEALTDNRPGQAASSGTLPALEAFCCEEFFSGLEPPELVRVGYVDKALVPERQTVTMGISFLSTSYMSKLVRRFNRSNKEYTVEIKDYENMDAFTEELLFQKEEIPDLLEVGWLDKEMLEKKGLLADLKPCFEESGSVGEEDILEMVWNACESDGVLTSMMTSFSIRSLAVSVDTVPREGWTYDQFFDLAEACPDSRLLQTYTPTVVWNLLSRTMASYIDWDEGKCSFDSPEFIHLLECVGALDYPENQVSQTVWYESEEIEKFIHQEFLVMDSSNYSPNDFSRRFEQYKGKAWEVGYPTQEGELCYLLHPGIQFSIYENASCKEGAWAFLEFALSEAEQSWYGSEGGGFPVRKEAFETYLIKPFHPLYNMQSDYSSQETAERIRDIAGHLRVEQPIAGGKIADIIREETGAFFAGDKTAEQCVEAMQNRVQLYLDENF